MRKRRTAAVSVAALALNTLSVRSSPSCFALYTVAGGICIHGRVAGTPLRNTALLALGALRARLKGR